MNALTVLRISRPRFWLYLAGPLMLGVAASASSITSVASWQFGLLLLVFLIPANVFLYGINDLFDSDTDAHNAKKGTKEHRLHLNERATLRIIVALSALVVFASAAILAWQRLWFASGLTLLFLALGAAYSAPPLRLKAKPIVDSASNVLYVVPGLVGYSLFANAPPEIGLVLGFACWTAAMHLFSAIPDIAADRRAHLQTTATFLGPRRSLLTCSTLWLIFAAILVTRTDARWIFAPVFLYAAIPLSLIGAPASRIDRVYWWFPILTGVFGFLAFAYVLFSRFGVVTIMHALVQ